MNIGIDLDDVLADFTPALNDYHNEMHGTNFRVEDFRSYRFWETWNIDREESLRGVLEFSRKSIGGLLAVPGAREGIEKLHAQGHTLHIITARNGIFTEETVRWLDKHFPSRPFSGLHFADHLTINHREKGDICRDLGIEAMVDDSFDNAFSCASVCRTVLLWNKPWNLDYTITERDIRRVDSWDEVLEAFLQEEEAKRRDS